MSGKPAYLLVRTAYILLGSRNRKLLFADRIGRTIGRLFCANLQLGLGPRKGTNLG